MTRDRRDAGSHFGRALAREAELLAAIAAAEAELAELRTYVAVHRRLEREPRTSKAPSTSTKKAGPVANGHDPAPKATPKAAPAERPAPAKTAAPVRKGASVAGTKKASHVAAPKAAAPKTIGKKAVAKKTAVAKVAAPETAIAKADAPRSVAAPEAVAETSPPQAKRQRPSGTSPGDVVKMIELILEEAGKPCTREELVASLEKKGAVLATRKSKKWYISHILWRRQDVVENLGPQGYRLKPETPPKAASKRSVAKGAARNAAA